MFLTKNTQRSGWPNQYTSCKYITAGESWPGHMCAFTKACMLTRLLVQLSLVIPNPLYTEPLDIPNGFAWWRNSFTWWWNPFYTEPLDIPNDFPGHRRVRYSERELYWALAILRILIMILRYVNVKLFPLRISEHMADIPCVIERLARVLLSERAEGSEEKDPPMCNGEEGTESKARAERSRQ